jgi:hypothetical protein
MAKRDDVLNRNAKRFVRKLDEWRRERIRNNIDKKFRGMAEMTDMLLNCPSIKQVEKEITTLPKKEDII